MPDKVVLPLGQEPENKGQNIDELGEHFKAQPKKTVADKRAAEEAVRKEKATATRSKLKTAHAPRKDVNKIPKLVPGGLYEKLRKENPKQNPHETLKQAGEMQRSGIIKPVKRTTQQTTKAVQDIIKNVAKTPEKVAVKTKSSADKLTDLALKEAQRNEQQRRTPSLPSISKDTATEIVIVSILVTFFFLAQAGTKFSELWQLSFTKSATGSGVGDFQGSGPGGLADDSWNISNPFHEVA